jgi:hypothetical protein
MVKRSKAKGDQSAVRDEPGAEQRFSNILKRALNTPPPRKKDGPKPGERKGKK